MIPPERVPDAAAVRGVFVSEMSMNGFEKVCLSFREEGKKKWEP